MQVQGNIAFSITARSAEEVLGEMPVQAGVLNPYGTVHAGAMLWFADVCATVLAFGGAEATVGGSGFPLAINLNAALLGNQREGLLQARSVYVKKGRTLSVVRTTVTGNEGRVLVDVTTSHVPSK